MFDTSQSNLFSQIPNQLHTTTNPNNNPYFLVTPPPFLPSPLTSEPCIHPPGTHQLAANLGSYPLVSVGFQAQTPNSHDPNSASKNWIVKQSAPIRCDSATVSKSENETSLLPPGSNSIWNVTTNIPQQTEVGQTISAGLSNQTSSIGRLPTYGMPDVAASVELAMKTRKILNSGTALDSVRMCTICNVACNSQEVFNKHMAGRKHKVQAGLASLGEIGSYFAAVRAQFDGTAKKAPKKVKFVQSAWCEVCKINCNSNDVYIKHLLGKKHQKNVEELNDLRNDSSSAISSTISSASSPTPMIGPPEKHEASMSTSVVHTLKSSKRATGEDLEAKKRKVLSAGGAAAAVRTCTICNVVCNSQTVFNFHLGGQKHADMLKKLQEAGNGIAGPHSS